MNRTAFKIAASTSIVAMTMVACTAQSEAMRRMGSPASAQSRGDRQAAQLHEQARRALQQGQLGAALAAMENAVALAPRDAGYRLLLAEIYMKSGRFESARATFTDVVEIDPSNVRGRLSLALMQVALGRPQAAVAQLDELNGRAGPADLGLAYALAGMPERAIEILEPAARGQSASPRTRQNLALSYAMAGDWQRARTVAAQDLSPADLAPRLRQWAAMAGPEARSGQVASLLGVSPVQDPGQPVRLALRAPAPVPTEAYAAVAPEPAPEPEPLPAPVAVYAEAAPPVITASESAPVSDWGMAPEPATPAAAPAAPPAFAPAPAPVPAVIAETEVPPSEAPSYYLPPPPPPPPAERSAEQVRYAAAARTLTRPAPAVVRTASVSLPPAPVFRRQAPQPVVPQVRRGNSRFVVQLGSFSIEANAERAWVDAERRFGLDDHQPLTTTFNHQGRTLHRVAIAGFAGQADAQRLCHSIRARGGACFVRGEAGDAAVRWAARHRPSRNRDA
jgi:Flp pilus assembly protein TadD